MPNKFFVNTIESKFIKSLVSNSPLPVFNTVRDGDLVLKDRIYVYKDSVIQCTKTGVMSPNNTDASYKILSGYAFGEEYFGVTSKYFPSSTYYDKDTHKELGRYLRCYRDIKGVNLMPFYNCFNYTVFADIHIKDGIIKYESSKDYKVLGVPIKFNKTYTIAIECSSGVKIYPIIYGKCGIVNDYDGKPYNEYDALSSQFKSINVSRFNTPFTYKVDMLEDMVGYDLLLNAEKDLYIAIQLPASNESSIVVLEGDYTESNYAEYVYDVSMLKDLSDSQEDKLFTSKPSLLMLNDGVTYAFSNRLIEYLLLNVIDKSEIIDNNIVYVHKLLGMTEDNKTLMGVWNAKTRARIYDLYKNVYGVYDMSGYVDKDVENLLTKGVNV